MIILVGAGGFLGYSLARHFSNKGIHFATISRSFQWLPALFERRFIGSASEAGDFFGDDYDGITVLYMAGSPNLVLAEQDPLFDLDFHLSEIKSFLQFFLNLKSVCKRFYFFSSAGTVYGDSKGLIKTEMSELYPKSAYGKRNVALESFVLSWARANGAQASILRVTNPFGPGQSRFRRRGLIQVLIDSASSGQQVIIRGNGYQERDYIYIDNLCSMVEKLLQVDGIFEAVNIASGFSYSARQVVEMLNVNDIFPCVEYVDAYDDFEVDDSLVANDLVRSILSLSAEDCNPFKLDNISSMRHFEDSAT